MFSDLVGSAYRDLPLIFSVKF